MDAEDDPTEEGLTSRPPTLSDLTALCRELNRLRARYVVVGGFAVIGAGLPRTTGDVDLLIDTSPANEKAVFDALTALPDGAVRELEAGDVERYTVVRVADEIVVDLMKAACGVEFESASHHICRRVVDGVSIPFATPRLLWEMKCRTHREKDAPDLHFLRANYGAEIFDSTGAPLPLEAPDPAASKPSH